jgi:hypothetical protein
VFEKSRFSSQKLMFYQSTLKTYHITIETQQTTNYTNKHLIVILHKKNPHILIHNNILSQKSIIRNYIVPVSYNGFKYEWFGL